MINDITETGLYIREDGFYFLTTRENALEEDRTYDVEIRVDSGYKVRPGKQSLTHNVY